jgi:hypothetical protein
MHQTGWTALIADLLIDPPRHSRRMIFLNGPAGTHAAGRETGTDDAQP